MLFGQSGHRNYTLSENLFKGPWHREERAFNSARIRRQSAPSSESLGVSRVNHVLRVHGHTILEEQSAAAVKNEIGQRSFERVFPGLNEDSMTQATLSASQSGIGFKKTRDIAAPAHLGALIEANPRVQGMIRDAVLAGLLPEQVLETRLSEVIETATSTYLSALDSDAQGTARLFIQEAAQAADESWQHTVSGQQGPESQARPLPPWDILAPPLRMMTVMTWTSRRPGRADSVRRSSKRSFRD